MPLGHFVHQTHMFFPNVSPKKSWIQTSSIFSIFPLTQQKILQGCQRCGIWKRMCRSRGNSLCCPASGWGTSHRGRTLGLKLAIGWRCEAGVTEFLWLWRPCFFWWLKWLRNAGADFWHLWCTLEWVFLLNARWGMRNWENQPQYHRLSDCDPLGFPSEFFLGLSNNAVHPIRSA